MYDSTFHHVVASLVANEVSNSLVYACFLIGRLLAYFLIGRLLVEVGPVSLDSYGPDGVAPSHLVGPNHADSDEANH